MSAARVIVLSPHLDDAVLSCWSVLTGPGEVDVITVFAGLPPAGATVQDWDRITGASDPRRRMEERRREDRIALGLAGREPTHLEFLEQPYRTAELTVNEIVSVLAALITKPARVIAPAAIKRHPDHLLTRRAALALDGGLQLALYAELPYATRFGWPKWVTGGEAADYVDVDTFWRPYLTGTDRRFAPRPTVRALPPSERRRKLRAMRAYRTQFPGLDGGPQRRLSHPAVIAFEATWEPAGEISRAIGTRSDPR